MALKVGTAYVDIAARVAPGFQADVEKQVTPAAGAAGEKAGGALGSGFKKAAAVAAGTVIAAKAADFLSGAVAAARESAKIAAQTDAVIKSTRGAANVTSKEVGDLAESISKVTAVDDEAIQSAENLLLTFTNVRNEAGKGNDVFNKATKVLVDMGAALGTDASSSAIQLGKALNDPIKGITALTRVGVTFTEEQKSQIAAMVQAGNTAGAQKVILAELNKEFGGSAAAQATNADKLKVAWGNLEETIGEKLIPILETVTGFLVEHSDLIAPLAALIAGVLVVAFIAWAVNAAAAAAATIAAAAPVIAITAAIALLAAGIYLLVKNWDEVWSKVKEIVGAAVGWLVEQFKKIPGWIGDAMKGLANIITAPYRAAFNAIAKLWNNTVGKLKFKIPSWVPGIGGKGFDVPNIPEMKALLEGGDLRSLEPAWVGEGGVELWLPRVSGTVVSNDTILDALAGAGTRGGDTYIDARGVRDVDRFARTVNQARRDYAWLQEEF